MILVMYEHRDRRAGRFACHHTAKDLDAVFLDLHPSTGAISLLATGKFFVDYFRYEWKSRRHAIQNGSKRWSVGFTCREET
jgi:hypothetical protein